MLGIGIGEDVSGGKLATLHWNNNAAKRANKWANGLERERTHAIAHAHFERIAEAAIMENDNV